MQDIQKKKESFADLLDESIEKESSPEGKVVSGVIVAITGDVAVIDVGFKSEGRIPVKDLQLKDGPIEFKVGDVIDVYVERLEDKNGEVVLSVEKARREAAWKKLEKACETGSFVDGSIFGKVKGGFAVDLNGTIAFLPGSQVDLRPIKDIRPLANIVQPFKILKMDKLRNNVVVSRRAVLEDSRSEARSKLIDQLSEGQVLNGIVKNITDYGAFVDLGGIDGLLHVTDISWKRINHPGDVLKVGDTLSVQIIRFNKEAQRISLGTKQLADDPWKEVDQRFIVGDQYKGFVVNIADYGAFVELESGIEGLIYLTELSWTRKNIHPNQVLTIGQEIDVKVLEVDAEKRRISLSYKQCLDNPWLTFQEQFPVGEIIDGVVKNVTEFGIFVGVSDQLDGMVHLNDVAWENQIDTSGKFKKGQEIKVKILSVDHDRERISLGIKQLEEDPFETNFKNLKKGQIVVGTVSEINDGGVEVALESGVIGTIKRADLSRDRDGQRSRNFAVGDSIEAKVLGLDKSSRRVSLSIKAREIEEEKAVLSEIGSKAGKTAFADALEEAMRSKKDSE